ncbi:BTAD domain-containing putative transcriptional regulator [Streptomyces sp. NBC_01431]|uniref:BTAD domain-containing putative transcriptional regulator n=1 Tax=Streptomyces sp. NBC_01431 TaxID=2903863 RepID=UPI002E363599|nr:BTAD domain-containing putative transcriptional regulator [Streptomyces sp. NBC_01431]
MARFEDLVAPARRQREPADEALMLRGALALWQGPALGGINGTAPLLAATNALAESRLATVEQLADTCAVLGEHDRGGGAVGGTQGSPTRWPPATTGRCPTKRSND